MAASLWLEAAGIAGQLPTWVATPRARSLLKSRMSEKAGTDLINRFTLPQETQRGFFQEKNGLLGSNYARTTFIRSAFCLQEADQILQLIGEATPSAVFNCMPYSSDSH